VVMTALFSGGTMCCANLKGAPITPDNPAVAGEIIDLYATGLGLPVLNDVNSGLINTGVQYPVGGPETQPNPGECCFVSAMAGSSTADVLRATLAPGMVGVYLVELHLNSQLSTNSTTSLTIAQYTYVSNPVTIPVVLIGNQ
jgi:uncharacterized protein (TIGR03437 family)